MPRQQTHHYEGIQPSVQHTILRLDSAGRIFSVDRTAFELWLRGL